jgi:hypothetical protein
MNLSVISDSSVVVMCWVCSTKFDTRIKIGWHQFAGLYWAGNSILHRCPENMAPVS